MEIRHNITADVLQSPVYIYFYVCSSTRSEPLFIIYLPNSNSKVSLQTCISASILRSINAMSESNSPKTDTSSNPLRQFRIQKRRTKTMNMCKCKISRISCTVNQCNRSALFLFFFKFMNNISLRLRSSCRYKCFKAFFLSFFIEKEKKDQKNALKHFYSGNSTTYNLYLVIFILNALI